MAKTQIHRGKVAVDGNVCRNPSEIIDAEGQAVTYKGETVEYNEHIYILMNKPKGVLSATEDKSKKTVVDLIPDNMKRNGLFPVGRLDRDTTGLLIITDDGDFAHKCISPNKNVTKKYKVTLDGNIDKSLTEEFKKGVILADGTALKGAELEIIENNVAFVTVTEGKYHQIKRMFGVFDLGVNELERVQIGKLKLPNSLNYGECLLLDKVDLDKVLS